MKLIISLLVGITSLLLCQAYRSPFFYGEPAWVGNSYHHYGNHDYLASWATEAMQQVKSSLGPNPTEEQQEVADGIARNIESCLVHLYANHVGTYKRCLRTLLHQANVVLRNYKLVPAQPLYPTQAVAPMY